MHVVTENKRTLEAKNCLIKTDMKQLIYLSRSIIDINTFYRRFLTYLLDLKITHDKKYKLINVFKDNDILVNKSFKDLLYLEGFLIEVYKILMNSF